MPAVKLAATALGWLVVARWLHLTRPTPDLLARLHRPASISGGEVDAEALRWAVAAVSKRLPWRSDCLIQALAAKLWLDRAGVDSALRLGARADGMGRLNAHAWLEVAGVPVTGGRPDPALAPFLPLARDG